MTKVLLNIKDDAKAEPLLALLRQMDFLEVSESPAEKRPPLSKFLKAKGIWKDYHTSASILRDRAWHK